MDKKELEETIINALENNSQWYETWNRSYRVIERRDFERVAQEVAAQILILCQNKPQ